MSARFNLDQATLAGFCSRNHICRLSLFGSVLKGKDQPTSDVDLLVEFAAGKEPGLLALTGMEAELSALLGGAESRSAHRSRSIQLFSRRGDPDGGIAVCAVRTGIVCCI